MMCLSHQSPVQRPSLQPYYASAISPTYHRYIQSALYISSALYCYSSISHITFRMFIEYISRPTVSKNIHVHTFEYLDSLHVTVGRFHISVVTLQSLNMLHFHWAFRIPVIIQRPSLHKLVWRCSGLYSPTLLWER